MSDCMGYICLSVCQVKAEVDTAVGELVRPLKMKGQLVGQLQTQITDLEMFIQFLQVCHHHHYHKHHHYHQLNV